MSGHATYGLVDLVFLVVALLVGLAASVVSVRRASRSGGAGAVALRRRTVLVTGVGAGIVLLVMTVVFDNVIVGLHIVAYDPARISGLRIGVVPVEDLAYAAAAVLLLPSLGVLFGPTRAAAGREGTR